MELSQRAQRGAIYDKPVQLRELEESDVERLYNQGSHRKGEI